jgi:hypothetical protein
MLLRGIIAEFYQPQPLDPIRGFVFGKGPEVLDDSLVGNLSLSITLRVMTGAGRERGAKGFHKGLPEVTEELGITVTYEVGR